MKFASIAILATVSAMELSATDMAKISGTAVPEMKMIHLQQLIAAAAAAKAPITTDSTSVNKATTIPSTMPIHVASTMTGGSPMHVASTMTGGSMTLSAADLNMVSGTAAPMMMKTKPVTVQTAAHKAITQSKTAVPVTKEMMNGEMHHCAVMPAATVDTPATKVCSKDLHKVIAHAKVVVHPEMKTKPVTVQTAADKASTQSMKAMDLSGKVALPVTKEMMNGEMHHCVVMPAAKAAAPASTVKTVVNKVKTLMNLATPATVVAPATKVCSKDINKVIAHA